MPKVFGFAQYGDSAVQEFWEAPQPVPGPGELLIAVKAAGVNPLDPLIRRGDAPQVLHTELPAVLGCEAAGVVAGVGPDVEGFATGDEVFGNVAPGSGSFAEYALLTAASAAKKPPHVSFTDAATLSVAACTAYDCLEQLHLTTGQVLLIIGVGGGVGVAAAQIARDHGLMVIGTGSESKRSLVESMDATLIDYTGGDVAGEIRQILPDGVDGILDLVGGEALKPLATLVKDRFKIVSTVDPRTAMNLGGGYVHRDRSAHRLAEVAALVEQGKLDPHCEDVLPLEKAPAAVASVESGHSQGKVVIRID